MSTFHELTMDSLEGESIAFSQFQDQASLVVNVARSACASS